ncbi:DUF1156 domain-containing protein [Salinirubellus salinus]|uniref:DUF1156 domain-containing protein n=1 Tax=Salinirubellus salinus TaxID=1364945 RepID=A0A9E7R6P6_9EURY|nr:DNA methyltransferase [Salinirubellus salinus]UWM55688.1 DUF1156 domain-containing protein [Salinirubellus salinus]
METWNKLPLELIDELAEKETYRRDIYRPIYSLHKWWARRPGSTFRCLGLAALSDDSVTKDDILREVPQTGTHEGLYLNPSKDRIDNDAVVLDPFAGGGTSLVELNRLGADVIGYELNPVAWWIQKKSMDEVNIEVLRSEFDRIIQETREEVANLYTTTNPQTGEECEVLYYFQSQKIPCLTCDEEVQLFPRYQLAKTKATRPGALYCPNEECDDRVIELRDRKKGLDAGDEVTVEDGQPVEVTEDGNEVCPSCGHEFDPNDGNAGYGKYTCSNGHKHDIKETLQRRDRAPQFERFALQYVDARGEKKIKQFDESDAESVKAARERLEDARADLPIPSQEIPEGMAMTTGALLNYNYTRFSELFTDRHLLTFGLLFRKAWAVRSNQFEEADAQNIAEFLVTAISNCLERNSKLSMWDYGDQKGFNVFKRHAFIPRVQPVESNPLNHEGTVASLQNFFDKVERAKRYCERPFEKVKNRQSGSVEQFYINSESVSESRVAGLNCQTAEQLSESDESVDYVITDPPYYDNVQYSKLSDYFYVWLRECLQDEYEQFEPELVPKAREIVSNRKSGKDEEFFVESLTNVFEESHRVLKQDGELLFTYHHNENEAWSVILEALIKSGFTVTGAYPVQSEMPNSPHIKDLDNAEYDILVFANKDEADEEITLSELRNELYFEVEDLIEEERERHENLSTADLGVILRGKCMYHYSKHYPEVYADGEQVGVKQALDTVDSVIEQVVETSVDLPSSIDPLSRSFAWLVDRQPVEFNDLNKHLMAKGLSMEDLTDEALVTGEKPEKRAQTVEERLELIEKKLGGSNNAPDQGDDLLAIDKVQYLAHLYRTEQNTLEYQKAWKTHDLVELAKFIADATGNEVYENALEANALGW